MNSLRIRLFIGLGAGFFAQNLPAEVGEFTLSEKFLNQISIVSEQTAPFTKKGRLVTPSLSITISPQVLNSADRVGIRLGVDIAGSSKSKSYTPVTGKKGVTAFVAADVQAHFDQDLFFDGEKLLPSKLTGQSTIKPTNISVSNNFGLLKGVVNRKAEKQAREQVFAELPQERQDLERQVQEEIQKGLRSAEGNLRTITDEVSTIFSTAQDLPFESRFSSKTGPQGSVRLELSSKGPEKDRPGKPDFSLKDQIASSGVFHEDLLTETISKEIAGKEMKISEFKAYLCSETISSLINFCETDIPLGSVGLSVIFDDKNPISFKFEDGKVSIAINAKNRVGVNPSGQISSRLFDAPAILGSGQVEMEPYQVQISYKLKDGKANLEDIHVTSIPAPLLDLPNNKKTGNHGANNTFQGLWKRVSEATNRLVDSTSHQAIENEFKKIFKESIEFPTFSLPTKLKANQSNPTKPTILEAGSLIPLEVKAEKGWLAVSTSFCHESTMPLGVTFAPNNRIQSVQPGSPAALAGLKVGDRIESFSGFEHRPTALGADISHFVEFIQEKAIQRSSERRTVELKGKSSDGIPFSRQISLCPTYLNHRREAEKLLASKVSAKD